MKRDVIWGYLSQFLQYGAALLVLPLLLKKLTAGELGIWYVFMTISTLVTMLDMGFTPTLARSVSYILGGARQLHARGHDVVVPTETGGIDFGLLNALISASRRIFFLIACAAFLLLAIPGSLYIRQLVKGDLNQFAILGAWAVFVVATVINLFYKYYTPLLQGRALFVGFYKSSAIANLGFIGATALLLQLGWGLMAVAVGYLVSALVGRWLSWRYLYDEEFSAALRDAPAAQVGALEIFQSLWHNAWRLGLGVIGSFLILKANVLLSSSYLGLATTAAYALTLQVFSALQSVSTVVFNVQLPRLAQYRVANRIEDLRKTMELGLGTALGIFVLGAVVFVLFGNLGIRWIGGHTQLLATPLLAWVALMTCLELIHSLAAGVIVTGNQVPFVKAALLSGLLIVGLSWIGLHFQERGVAWLLAVQFFVQLAYNNWQWPWRVYKEFYGQRRQEIHT